MIQDLFNNMQYFTAQLPELLQWFGVMVAGAIPFLEGYSAAVIGIVVGISPIVAVFAAILGNTCSMLVGAFGADWLRGRLHTDTEKRQAKHEKLRSTYEKYGVPVVSLIAEMWVPSIITTVLLISFGASRTRVIIWQIVAITVWAVGAALVTTGVLSIAL